jgi:hypothetical protein
MEVRNELNALTTSVPGQGVGKHGSCLGHSGVGGAATENFNYILNNSIFNISKFLTLWNIFL